MTAATRGSTLTPVRRNVDDPCPREIQRPQPAIRQLDVIARLDTPWQVALDLLHHVPRQQQHRPAAVQRPQQARDPSPAAGTLEHLAHEHAGIRDQDDRAPAYPAKVHNRRIGAPR